MLLAVTHSDVCVVVDDSSRKSVLTSMSAVYGRQIHFVRPDVVSSNFNDTIVGGIVTNTWLYIEGLDRKQGHYFRTNIAWKSNDK
jgi:molybdate-binding protein